MEITMKGKYIYIITLLFTMGVFPACKKYPEGPFLSLRTKEKRIHGSWHIEKYLINDIDSTSAKYPIYDCYVAFDVSTSSPYWFFNYCDSSGGGQWKFTDHKNSITFYNNKTDPIILSSIIQWDILKLKFKEMHLRTEFNYKKYDIYLSKL